MSTSNTRRLSLHERFSLARRNCGFPHGVTFVLSYPSPGCAPSHAHLCARAEQLQAHFPLLWARVADGRTRTPRFEARDRPWRGDEVVVRGSYEAKESKAEEMERIVYASSAAMNSQDDQTDPAWKVAILTPKLPATAAATTTANPIASTTATGSAAESASTTTPASAVTTATETGAETDNATEPTHTRTYLAVSAMHEVIDGRGLANLALALVAPESEVAQLPFETLGTIPRLEDTVPLKPPITHVLPVALRVLVLPRLPSFVQNLFRQVRPWPAGHIKARPTEVPFDLSLLPIAPELVGRLKAAGKAHGVPALHATLQTAYSVAIWARFHATAAAAAAGAEEEEGAAEEEEEVVEGAGSLDPFTLRVSWPVSERDAALGHAYCTANYVSSCSTTLVPRATQGFWAVAAATSAFMRSAAGRAAARYGMGMLAYVPDPAPDPARQHTTRPTGWEAFFLDTAEGPYPYSQALNMSNLGAVALPPGSDDAVWGQMASPFGPLLAVDVLGHNAGLRVVTIWRDGAVVTRPEVKALEKVFHTVLDRLADPAWHDVTLGGLVKD